MAIPNNSAANAITLALPATVILDTSLIAPDAAAWYKVTTQALRYLLSAIVTNTTTEFPAVTVYQSDGVTPLAGGNTADRLDPINYTVLPLTLYYVTITPSGGATAVITMNLAEAPYLSTALGDLMVFGEQDTAPTPVVLQKATGDVIRTALWDAASFSVAVTPSGIILANNYTIGSNLQLGDAHTLAVTGTVVKPVANKYYTVKSDKVSAFYITPVGAPASGVVYKVTEAGVVTVKATVALTNMQANDVSVGGHKIYYNDQTAGSGWAVKCWDLDADAALANFAAGVAGYRVYDILVLANDAVVVAYIKTTDRTLDFIRIYSSVGVALLDVQIQVGFETGQFSGLVRDDNDPLRFWWMTSKISNFTQNCRYIKASDGSDTLNYTIATTANGYLEDLTAVGKVFWAGGSTVTIVLPAAASTLPLLAKLDDAAALNDFGTPYKAYIKSRAMLPAGVISNLGEVRDPILTARAQAATAIQLTITKDFGRKTQLSTVDLTALGSETRVIRKFEGAAEADAAALQFTLGDAVAIDSIWALDGLHLKDIEEGEK